MARYVFTIYIKNKTQYSVFPVGGSTLAKLDGNTSYGTLTVGSVSSGNNSGKVEITKSRGVEGLFTALTWWVGPDHSGWGEAATVNMINTAGMSWQQFKESGDQRPANNYHYQKRCEGGGSSFKDIVDDGGVRVQLENRNLGFPNSDVTVVVSKEVHKLSA
ncbi:Fc.00g028530.m01.CDS01 [Cosmosporella sp. VM-42]